MDDVGYSGGSGAWQRWGSWPGASMRRCLWPSSPPASAASPWRPLPCRRLFAGSSRNLPPATPIPCPATAPRRCGPFFRRCGRPRRRQGAAAAAPRCYGPFFRAAARPACGWAPALCQPPSYTSCAGAAPAIAPCTPPLPPAARPATPIGRPRPRPARRRLGLPPPPVDGGCLPPRHCPGQPAPGTPRIAPSAPPQGRDPAPIGRPRPNFYILTVCSRPQWSG